VSSGDVRRFALFCERPGAFLRVFSRPLIIPETRGLQKSHSKSAPQERESALPTLCEPTAKHGPRVRSRQPWTFARPQRRKWIRSV